MISRDANKHFPRLRSLRNVFNDPGSIVYSLAALLGHRSFLVKHSQEACLPPERQNKCVHTCMCVCVCV